MTEPHAPGPEADDARPAPSSPTPSSPAVLDAPSTQVRDVAAPAPSAPEGAGLVDRALHLYERWTHTRLSRALERYGTARGALLAGGIAYTGLFSVFAVLAIGVTFLMMTLGGSPQVRQAVAASIERSLPGLLDDGSGGGLVSLDQLTLTPSPTLGSVVAACVLLYSALSLMAALRSGVQAMFGITYLPDSIVTQQLWNLANFILILVAAGATMVSSLVAGALVDATHILPAWLSSGVLHAVVLGSSFVIDAVTLCAVVRVCGVRVPWRDMLEGAALGAVGFGALRVVGVSAVGSVSRNPVLASFTTLVVLVLWLHLASRILLLTSAWMANPPRPKRLSHPDEVHAYETPNYVTESRPHTLAWPRQNLSGTVDVDVTAHPDYTAPEAGGRRAGGGAEPAGPGSPDEH